jgi:hypothetical protein
MSAKQLREALVDTGSKGVSQATLAEQVGIDTSKVRKILWPFINRGEVNAAEDAKRGTVYTLVEGYAAARKSAKDLPLKRRPKKKRGHKKAQRAPRNARPFKDLAEKHHEAAFNKLKMDALIVENALTAGDSLVKAIREQVENLDDNPALVNAIKQHELASEIARAAGVNTPF